jgi:DNA polymerase III delta subunit
MAVFRYREWARRFDSGEAAAAVLLCGPESWLRDQALARIKQRIFGDPDRSRLGHDRFYGGEGPLGQVTTALASVGLFTPARLVTLANAEKSYRAGAAERRELLELLKRGTPGSWFVALSELPVSELEKKSEWTRGLLQACQTVDLAHPKEDEAVAWLAEESRRRGVPFDKGATNWLVDRIGPDLQELSRELEKLALCCQPGDQVSVQQLGEMVHRGELGKAPEFCRAVLDGETAQGLRLLEAIRRTEPALLTQWQLQRRARDRIRFARSKDEERSLLRILRRAFDAERAIKSGRIPSGQDGTALFITVASSAGTRAGAPKRA